MVPLQRRPEDLTSQPTSTRILDAAADLFAEKGYAATKTRQIAEISKLERPSLYYHIHSKEELLYRICRETMEDALRVVRSVDATADPVERIRELITAHTITILRNRTANVTMLLEMRSLTGERFDEIVTMRDTYEKLARQLIIDAQNAGMVRPDEDARLLTLTLLNLLNWTLVWYRNDDEYSAVELADAFQQIFLHGVANHEV